MRLTAVLGFVCVLLGSVYLLLIIPACGLETGGLCTESRDPDFRGCFEKTDPPTGSIHIFQTECNQLRGTGEGIFDSELWSFTGLVEERGLARLFITTESGGRANAEARRGGGDTLTLTREGETWVSPPLQRCR